MQVLKRQLKAAKYASVALLVDASGFILVAERSNAKPLLAGCMECPGGELERDDTPVLGAQREVREETGLDIEQSRFDNYGSLVVNGWWIWLYIVRLHESESPAHAEPEKRGPWMLIRPEEVEITHSAPSLSCLVAALLDERRAG